MDDLSVIFEAIDSAYLFQIDWSKDTAENVLAVQNLLRPAYVALKNKGWQPIATAPLDGTDVLAIDVVRGYSGLVKFIDNEWESLNITGDAMGIGFYPSHWMPLPKPPEENFKD